MICPCGGDVVTAVRSLATRRKLLEWFPHAINQPLPATLTVRTCRACGRLDKQLHTLSQLEVMTNE